MTSHAWLKSKSHPHSFTRVHGKIFKLGSGNFLEEITKNKYNQGGLTLKDLKPDTFGEQREEQVVLSSVVRRVLIVGRTD